MHARLLGVLATTWLALSSSIAIAATSPVGYWKSIDDETGKPKSVVQVWQDDKGKVHGKIVKLYRQPDEEADPVCDECEGSKHNQRIIGMTIISDLADEGDEWSGGEILDPGNGKVYSCYIVVDDTGKKLEVRGYMGFSLLGRSQNWLKTSKPTDEVEYLK